VAGGLWASPAEAVEATVRPTGTVEPVADWIEPYREGRERFRALYPALKGV
jgi:xylulokinase